MLSEEEQSSLHEVLQEIRVDEERKAFIDLRDRATALRRAGNRLVKLPGAPLRMR
ncbi:MAG: hypothetical protein JWO68_3296 [Actinomycetia bacterium]|nr:hypothetical protein [Actinomycetes bacterium]